MNQIFLDKDDLDFTSIKFECEYFNAGYARLEFLPIRCEIGTDIDNSITISVIPSIEYQFSDNSWLFELNEIDNACQLKWETDKETFNLIQKELAKHLCKYSDYTCNSCEFFWATNFECPLNSVI